MDGDFTFLDENCRPLYGRDRAKAADNMLKQYTAHLLRNGACFCYMKKENQWYSLKAACVEIRYFHGLFTRHSNCGQAACYSSGTGLVTLTKKNYNTTTLFLVKYGFILPVRTQEGGMQMRHKFRESAHRGMSQSPRIDEQACIWPLVLHNTSPLAYRLHSLCTVAQHRLFHCPTLHSMGFSCPLWELSFEELRMGGLSSTGNG